jgi:signal peptidase
VLSSILLGSVVLVIVVVIVGMVLGAWRFTVIDTGSMRPTLNPGDVAVLTSEHTAELKPGQIVAFHPPGEPRLTVMHRAVSVERKTTATIIQTKGDANNAKDQWRAHLRGDVVWYERLKVPVVGHLAVWSQQPLVRLGVLIAIVMLAVGMSLGWIWRPVPR